MLKVLSVMTLLAAPSAMATEYRCPARREFFFAEESSPSALSKWKPSVQLKEQPSGAYVSRCLYNEAAARMSCDLLKVEVMVDPFTQVKKFYDFMTHYDFQLFPSGVFVENTGRGWIRHGICEVVR